MLRTTLPWSLLSILEVAKIYYGWRWLRFKSRVNFMPYYRTTVTLSYSSLCMIASILIVMVQMEFEEKISTYYFIPVAWITILCVLEIIIMQLHINYLDQIHFAEVRLLKNKQILRQYTLLREQGDHQM